MGILASAEFWSAIAGAVVGGFIAFGVQMIALRETRKQQIAEHQQRQKALAHSLVFKMIGVHSNFRSIRRHFDDCLRKADEKAKAEPWQIVLPLANFPENIHFSSEEMG